jgi:predicted nucleic acid-binding protein
VKLVVEEAESLALRDVLARDPDQIASAVVEVEVVRAVRRAVPELVERASRVVAQITVIEPNEAIRSRAAALEPVTLRTLDALQLATALEISEELSGLVTYDRRMSDAAAKLGLTILMPA